MFKGRASSKVPLKLVLTLTVMMVLSGCADSNSEKEFDQKVVDDQIEAKLIYGEDNRLENYQASNALRSLAASTVALVKKENLPLKGTEFLLTGSKFGDSNQLCASEPYREETAGAFCSGFLVASDVIVTAGHCITSQTDCDNVRFVFDFALTAPGVEKKTFTNNDVYSCQSILGRQQQAAGADFAVIKLNRAVVGRSPLKYRFQTAKATLNIGDQVVVIGHPSGLPQKIAGGGSVRSIQAGFFVTNLDTYGGNSGSAVFNQTSGLVEGILVRGDTDFVSQGSCYVSNKCSEAGCRGEDVTRMDVLASLIPSSGGSNGGSADQADETFSSNVVAAIPDSPKVGILSSIQVGAVPDGRDVQVRVDIAHTYRGDLLIELISSEGKVLVLHNRTGGSLDDVRGTYGVDLLAAQSLTTLSSVAKTGTWSLRITDKAQRDVGALKGWSLLFRRRQ